MARTFANISPVINTQTFQPSNPKLPWNRGGRMSSFRRLISSRANAARSTGPRTAAGKRRSSQNALRHGCYSRTPLLPNESPSEFDTLLQTHLSSLHPRNPAERACINQMAQARWRQTRFAAALERMLDEAIEAQPPHFKDFEPLARIQAAYMDLLDNHDFQVLSSTENTESHRYYRALTSLLKLKRRSLKEASISRNEPTLPFPYAPSEFVCIRVHSWLTRLFPHLPLTPLLINLGLLVERNGEPPPK
jgi:hypothetical protein